jgi:hypothetical protein
MILKLITRTKSEGCKGLHPLFSELIIVAVAVAVSLAAVAWITGVLRSTEAKAEAVLRIYNATLYIYPNGSCMLSALFKVEGGPIHIVKVWSEPFGLITNYTLTPKTVNGRLEAGVVYKFTARFSQCRMKGFTSGKLWVESDNGMEFIGFYNVIVVGKR